MIKSLHIENFRVLSGVHDYEFPEGIIGIVGPNGQGKSTLINSIAWALYGQEALPLRARDPVTWGQKQALVRVHLSLNDGQEWTVERSQSSTRGKAKLWNGEKVKAEGSAPVTNAVTELLGVDREGFLISVFARQFELDRLRSMDPTPRMQTVLRLLGINQITKAVKIVRDEANGQKRALDALRGHQIDADALNAQIGELLREREIIASETVTDRADLEGRISMRDSLEQERLALKPVDHEGIERLKAEYLRERDNYTALKSDRDRIQRELNTMQDVCPACKRPFDGAEHRERERSRMTKEIETINRTMEKVTQDGQTTKIAWETAVRNASEEEQRLRRAIDEHNAYINHTQQNLVRAEAELKGIDRDLSRLNTQLEEASRSAKESKKIEKDVVEKETTAQELQRLKEQMIGGIIPALNERASALIEQMTDGKYNELSLTPEYEIEYRNSQGDLKNFLNLSGGEQTVFALALRLAISDLRAGNLGVLFLDEAISSLSSEDGRQESVWSSIESLVSRFRQVFVITHVDAFKDRAPFSVRL